MGYDDGGPALGGLAQGLHDAVLRDGVQGGGGLVEDQGGAVLEDVIYFR